MVDEVRRGGNEAGKKIKRLTGRKEEKDSRRKMDVRKMFVR